MKKKQLPYVYVNRELSWLEFNQRVLNQALRKDLPLLERVKFLAITASNLDEFFMVRVGGLKMMHRSGSRTKDITGMTVSAQLRLIRARVAKMIADQYVLWGNDLLKQMQQEGISPLAVAEISESQCVQLNAYFNTQVLPLLTPLAMDDALADDDLAAAVAPGLPSLQLLLAVVLHDARSATVRTAVVPVPTVLPRRVHLQGAEADDYVMIEDVVRHFVGGLFPGEKVTCTAVFRVTRNGDIAVQEEDALDLADEMEEVLVARKFAECVRLEVEAQAPPMLVQDISRMVRADRESTFLLNGPLMLSDLMNLAFAPGNEHLKVEAWTPQPSPSVDATASMFENMAREDILLHHPYEGFEPVARLIEEAAEDPDVLVIKQVLYRTAKESRIVAALKRAAENGKQVTALVELKARFDEAPNLAKADALQRAGVQVVYGVKGFKTHAKICMIVRKEGTTLRRYCHFGTGNYNETTAKIYTDVSLLTCDETLGVDASQFFNTVTGRTRLMNFRKLHPSPALMKEHLLTLIQGESQRAKQGEPARIIAKMNSLQDKEMIDALYAAADAGVEVCLNIRGICCLDTKPRANGNVIKVVSIIDRYLEHARIFYFHHSGDPRAFIASADWMTRNLDKRVELMIPITEPVLLRRLKGVLDAVFKDNTQASVIFPGGGSKPLPCPKGTKKFRLQESLTKEARRRSKEKDRERLHLLQPHKPHNS